MWRMTLPDAGAPPPEAHHHPTLHERMDGLRHALGEVVKPHVARCSICHMELNAQDSAQGYCSDGDGCSCRAFSARCW